jgi:hypothetical protein
MMNFRLAALLFLPLLVSAQGDKPIIDNERVAVWDVNWTANQPGFAVPGDYDAVTVYLAGGDFRTGTSSLVKRKTGEAVFRPRGARPSETWVGTGTAPRTVEIELKDRPLKENSVVAPLPNTTGYPLAFPRPGSKKLIENERILVWDYTWQPGVATPMHFHDKDVVVSYLKDGDLTSITPDGKSVVNPYRFGAIRFNLRDRTHKEVLTRGEQRAIIVELK